MYILDKVSVKRNYRWEVLENHDVLISDLRDNYQDCFIDLTMDNVTRVQINLSSLYENESIGNTVKLNEWIVSVDYVIRPEVTRDRLRDISVRNIIKYHNVYKVGFNVTRGRYGSVDAKYTPDLVLTNNKHTTMDYFKDNCLFLVRGRVIESKILRNEIFLLGGSDIIDNTENKFISMLDFKASNGYILEKLTSPLVRLFSKTRQSSTAHITSRQTIKYKTAILIIRGKWFVMSNRVTRVNDHTVAVNLDHRELIASLIGEKEQTMDWSGWNERMYDLSDVDVEKCLTSGDCYMLFLNADVGVKKDRFGRTGLPNRYKYHTTPTGIMLDNYGYLIDYSIIHKGKSINTIHTSTPLISLLRNTNDNVTSDRYTNNTRYKGVIKDSMADHIELYTL